LKYWFVKNEASHLKNNIEDIQKRMSVSPRRNFETMSLESSLK